VLLALLMMLLQGCQSAPPAVEPVERFPGFRNIALIPVQDMAAIYGASRNVRNPLSGRVFYTGSVSAESRAFLEGEVYRELLNAGRFSVIAPESVLGVMSSLTSNNISERSLWVETGRLLKADGVMVCFLYRFRERVGTRYAAEVPASVAFDVYLLRSIDGRVVWSARFDETQQALSENILKFQSFMDRKGWVSASELATEGVQEALSTLPRLESSPDAALE
jgi:hypothetical protein